MRVTEVFHSLQGESRPAGWPTAFVRLTGCPLRCLYCDTRYAFQGGQRFSVPEILQQVAAFSVRYVCVTGGEPLAQPGCHALLVALCDAGYSVSLETGGALDITATDPRVTIVLDIKTPASGESGRNRWENLPLLKGSDQVKFVICDRADYDWAVDVLARHRISGRCEVLFSPAWQQLQA
ncbi:MAG: radical SAM protein, partial [Gammaproteobacteria bacterium]|nr:radical SAM protein [Gammaproteobacteria bacterium]